MKIRICLYILLLAIAAALVPSPALADGIIIPDPPICNAIPCPPPPCPGPWPCPPPSPMVRLVIKYHRVDVTIQDQVAVTHVDQVFYNPNNWPVEGTYIFPLPKEAAATSFILWVDGKPLEGQILDADQARRKYQEIVSSLRDPALLEYAGQGAVQAHIFPIPPQGERRIELEYTQALPAENGLVRYVYPLSTEKFSAWPLEQVTISLDIQASIPLRAAYSPSHAVSITRLSGTHLRAGYEASQVLPAADFALYYSLGEEQAFHMLTFRDPADPLEPDGFFLLLLAARPDASETVIAKDVLLVLDRSGSMEGEKFQQAQEALRYILKHLNPEDRFNLIAFSTGTDSFAAQLRPASEAEDAIRWVDQLSALGSTDINRALLEAASMAEGERPTNLIFLTDGLPTEGVVDSALILSNLQSAAPKNLRLFAFGVGYDVDTFLLDSLAQAHHGASSYVLPGERLDEVLSAFYAKVSTPVLTNLELDFGEISVYDLYPTPLPDLFSGSQVVLVGRYRKPGVATVTLKGEVNNRSQTFQFPGQVFERSSLDDSVLSAIPRLWATRKIGYLLNLVRLKGPDPETIEQIVRLSIRYGIVTPYTSFLVTEEVPLGADAQERIANEQFGVFQATASAPVYGPEAVQKAADQGGLAGAEAPVPPDQASASTVRIAGSHAFVLQDGKWIDTAFDPQWMQTVQVAFLSDDYFALIAARPDLAVAFALGPAVIAVSEGIAYEVVPQGTQTPPIVLPATITPARPVATGSVVSATPGAPMTPPPPSPAALPCVGGFALILLPLGTVIIARQRPRKRPANS